MDHHRLLAGVIGLVGLGLVGCGGGAASSPALETAPVDQGERVPPREARLLALEAAADGDVLLLPAGWLEELPHLRAAFAPRVRELGEEWRFVAGVAPNPQAERYPSLLEASTPLPSHREQDSITHTWRAVWHEEDADLDAEPAAAVLEAEGFVPQASPFAGDIGLATGLWGEVEPTSVHSYADEDGATATLRIHEGITELSITTIEPLGRDAAGALLGELGRRVDEFAPLHPLIDTVGAGWSRLDVSRSASYSPVYGLVSEALPAAVGREVERRMGSLPLEPEAWPFEQVDGRLFRCTDPATSCWVVLSVAEPPTVVRLLSEPPS